MEPANAFVPLSLLLSAILPFYYHCFPFLLLFICPFPIPSHPFSSSVPTCPLYRRAPAHMSPGLHLLYQRHGGQAGRAEPQGDGGATQGGRPVLTDHSHWTVQGFWWWVYVFGTRVWASDKIRGENKETVIYIYSCMRCFALPSYSHSLLTLKLSFQLLCFGARTHVC